MRYSAVLLAGGKSSRMGCDKALLEIDGQPLWQRQLATLRELDPEQLFIAGPARAAWREQVIADEPSGAGPLAGLAAALRQCAGSHLAVLAIDLPAMTADFLRSLLEACAPEKGIVPRMLEAFEPLAAVYPVGCAALTMDCLRRGEFSLQSFVRRALDEGLVLERTIAPEEIELFRNLNTPADYEKFRQRAVHLDR